MPEEKQNAGLPLRNAFSTTPGQEPQQGAPEEKAWTTLTCRLTQARPKAKDLGTTWVNQGRLTLHSALCKTNARGKEKVKVKEEIQAKEKEKGSLGPGMRRISAQTGVQKLVPPLATGRLMLHTGLRIPQKENGPQRRQAAGVQGNRVTLQSRANDTVATALV